MGNKHSTPVYTDTNVFKKELEYVNSVISNILTEDNLFKNKDYNFLSEDVCNQHYVIMEKELHKHLKIDVQNLGNSLYLIPKDNDKTVNKKEICKKITHHYMKILYIICLIKYVYNVENNGDMSVSGIMFRNVKIVDNIMEINFCNVPQKDYRKSLQDAYKIDFSNLEGLQFLAKYFLDNIESQAFIKVLRHILNRSSKKTMHNKVCEYIADIQPSLEHTKQIEKIYLNKYGDKLSCSDVKPTSKSNKNISLLMYVNQQNPVFSKEFCYKPQKYIIQINTPNGKHVFDQYKEMQKNYTNNISQIEKLLGLLIIKGPNEAFYLRDTTQVDLNKIIVDVKDVIKTYYFNSILDFQKLLDLGMKTPNINVHK